jgi:hypothetical protein
MLRAIELRATAFYGINSVFFTGPSLKTIWPWFVMALLRGGHFPRTRLLCIDDLLVHEGPVVHRTHVSTVGTIRIIELGIKSPNKLLRNCTK